MKKLFKKHPFIATSFFIILIWVIYFVSIIAIANNLHYQWPPNISLEALNSFGGNFNVLASLFTGLAFAGVIISIHLQSKELKTAIGAFEGQKNALQNQELDNKFFQMLHFFAEVKRNVKCCIDGTTYGGNEVFEPLIKKLLDAISIKYQKNEDKDILKIFKKEFAEFNNEYEAVKYYFLNLYQILNYIKRQPVDEANNHLVKLYTNMLRAQLSKNELILLAYNSIGVQAFTNDNYQKLMEKYAFFEHLNLDDFKKSHPDKQEIILNILDSYEETAFGTNAKFTAQKKAELEHYTKSE